MILCKENPHVQFNDRMTYSETSSSPNNTSITITKPDDWHIHLRDNAMLKRTVSDAAKQFNRAIVMPNLLPPVTTADAAANYRNRIIQATPSEFNFDPLMLLYLTDNTTKAMVKEAADSEHVVGFKWYPAGATTNSDSGVTSEKNIYKALESMQELNLVLCIHGEVTSPEVDIFDREAVFIEQTLNKIIEDFPELRIVFEHITTKDAVDYVFESHPKIGATITAHHLLFNRNQLLAGGIRPHYYCLPVLKRKKHQNALIKAATSGNPKFFLGTDSAPHTQDKKETDCGCAGAYTAYNAIELYATAFEQANALEKLQGFAGEYGANFYGLPINQETITLIKEPTTIPESLTMYLNTSSLEQNTLIPLCAGETLPWKLI